MIGTKRRNALDNVQKTTRTDAYADRTYENLATLRSRLPELRAALVPGTPRRWNQVELSDTARAHADDLARTEKAARAINDRRGITAFGESRAPLRVDVLDALDAVAYGIRELESAVCDRLAITPLVGATLGARITRIIGLLDRIAYLDGLAEHVAAEASRLARASARTLGEAPEIKRMNAKCPECGTRSLRVIVERELIACINASCRCDQEDCACQGDRPRRHTWHFGLWPYLAEELGCA